MNTTELRLHDELHRVVDELAPTEIRLESILRGSPNEWRRPLRSVVLAVAAVALAVALPIAVIALLHYHASKIGPTTITPTPRPTPGSTVTFSLSGLRTGPAASVRYDFGRQISSTATERVPPPIASSNGQIIDFGRYQDGWIALVVDNSPTPLCFFDSQGALDHCVYGYQAARNWILGFTRSQDGLMALSLNAGEVTLVDKSGTVVQTWQTGIQRLLAPLAVLPDHSVVLEAGWPGSGGPAMTVRVMPDGNVTTLPGLEPNAVNPINGDLSLGSALGCSRVVELDSGETMWQECSLYLGEFSPDGALLVAASTDSTGLEILKAGTGDTLLRFAIPPDVEWSPHSGPAFAWEDSTHVLVNAHLKTSRQYIVLRFGTDGTVEKVGVPPQA